MRRAAGLIVPALAAGFFVPMADTADAGKRSGGVHAKAGHGMKAMRGNRMRAHRMRGNRMRGHRMRTHRMGQRRGMRNGFRRGDGHAMRRAGHGFKRMGCDGRLGFGNNRNVNRIINNNVINNNVTTNQVSISSSVSISSGGGFYAGPTASYYGGSYASAGSSGHASGGANATGGGYMTGGGVVVDYRCTINGVPVRSVSKCSKIHRKARRGNNYAFAMGPGVAAYVSIAGSGHGHAGGHVSGGGYGGGYVAAAGGHGGSYDGGHGSGGGYVVHGGMTGSATNCYCE